MLDGYNICIQKKKKERERERGGGGYLMMLSTAEITWHWL